VKEEDEDEKSLEDGLGGTNKENQDLSNSQLNVSGSPGRYGKYGSRRQAPERKPVTVTPSLRILQASRATRTEREVEDEFKQLAADKKAALKTGASPKPVAKKE